MHFFLAASAAAIVGSVAAAPNCSNPVFVDGSFNAPKLSMVSGAPKPHPKYTGAAASLPCAAYAGASASCCTEQTLTEIADFFEEGDALLEAASQAIQDNDYPTQLADELTSGMDTLCGFLGNLPFGGLAATCKAAEEVVDDYAGKMAQAAEDIVAAEIDCAQALRTYFKGVLCFACSPIWDEYLVFDASGALVGLEVNQNTCVRIVDECAAVNTGVIAVAELATSFAEDLITAFSSGLFSPNLGDLVTDLPDACGGTLGAPGNCDDFYCHTLLSGANTPVQANWGWAGAGGLARARALAAVQAASASVNVYTATGYDAAQVGAADEPAQGGLSAGGAAAVAIVVILVIAGATTGVVLHVRGKAGVSRSAAIPSQSQSQASSTAASTYNVLDSNAVVL